MNVYLTCHLLSSQPPSLLSDFTCPVLPCPVLMQRTPPKNMHVELTPFLEKNTSLFMKVRRTHPPQQRVQHDLVLTMPHHLHSGLLL